MMYGGMRGMNGLVTETSVVDPEEVRYCKRCPYFEYPVSLSYFSNHHRVMVMSAGFILFEFAAGARIVFVYSFP